MSHQVVADGYLAGAEPAFKQGSIQKSRIQHNIPVVGNKQVLLLRIQMLQSARRKLPDTDLLDQVQYMKNDIRLKTLNGIHTVFHFHYVIKQIFR